MDGSSRTMSFWMAHEGAPFDEHLLLTAGEKYRPAGSLRSFKRGKR